MTRKYEIRPYTGVRSVFEKALDEARRENRPYQLILFNINSVGNLSVYPINIWWEFNGDWFRNNVQNRR